MKKLVIEKSSFLSKTVKKTLEKASPWVSSRSSFSNQKKEARELSTQRVRIALDAMGGDRGISTNLQGAILAYEKYPNLEITLVGDPNLIESELQKIKRKKKKQIFSIVAASQNISMTESATKQLRRDQTSSIHVGLQLLKKQEVDAFFSAGHSGAIMTASILILGRIPGIDRPAIVVRLPSATSSVLLLDAGANVDCKPIHLVQFAEMGNIYAKAVEEIENPRIGILANGVEEKKGNILTRKVHQLLSQRRDLNYQGYVEGYDIFHEKVDIVICDGFVGNVTLKVMEGLMKTSLLWFRRELSGNIIGKVGLTFLQKLIKKFRQKFDSQPVGAAPLLGINGLVLIGHGDSSVMAIRNGIITTAKTVQREVLKKMLSQVELLKKLTDKEKELEKTETRRKTGEVK